ncbi:MAG: hypothetical protein K0R17_1248 [Rariglobus sp.]|jgi:hypothetical protein|nr:hypothetical protein [Rariglobus sp.]
MMRGMDQYGFNTVLNFFVRKSFWIERDSD